MSFSLLFLSLFACEEKDGGFSSMGQSSLDPNDFNQQSGVNDTGGPGNSTNPDAPRIDEATAFFTEVTGVGDVIEVHIIYSDDQDDVMNGYVDVHYYSSSIDQDIKVNINGTDAILESGEITFMFQDVNVSEAYTFEMSLFDSAENESNFVETSATPVN